MSPKRLLAVASGALFVILLGVVWVRSGDDTSDGEVAIRHVASLKKGMTMFQMADLLHPTRTKRASGGSYTTTSEGKDPNVMYHALTPDRYLRMTYLPAPKAAYGTSPVLQTWELRRGHAPREDITIGRVVQLGPLRFHY